MSALPEVIPFQLPKKPKVVEKVALPDQRKVCVLPIRAITDSQVTDGMLRSLAILCSYTNRAGITWVSQAKLAQDMQVSRQAITKQLNKLQAAGYIEVVRKGFRGERTNTLRVIFDPSISAEEPIAITSSKEDTRPPAIKAEQERQQQADPQGQARIASLITKALKSPPKPKEQTMATKQDSMTVRKMKEEIAQAKSKGSHRQPNKVANEASSHRQPTPVDNSLHRQPHRQPNEVALNPGEHSIKEVIYKDRVLGNQEVEKLIADGLTAEQIEESLATLLPLYRAEGIEPTSQVLAIGIRQLQADAR